MSQLDCMQAIFKTTVMAGRTNECLYQIVLWTEKAFEFPILIGGRSGLRVLFLIGIKVQ